MSKKRLFICLTLLLGLLLVACSSAGNSNSDSDPPPMPRGEEITLRIAIHSQHQRIIRGVVQQMQHDMEDRGILLHVDIAVYDTGHVDMAEGSARERRFFHQVWHIPEEDAEDQTIYYTWESSFGAHPNDYDLFQIFCNSWIDLAAHGYLADLLPLIDHSTTSTRGDFHPAILDGWQQDGRLYVIRDLSFGMSLVGINADISWQFLGAYRDFYEEITMYEALRFYNHVRLTSYRYDEYQLSIVHPANVYHPARDWRARAFFNHGLMHYTGTDLVSYLTELLTMLEAPRLHAGGHSHDRPTSSLFNRLRPDRIWVLDADADRQVVNQSLLFATSSFDVTRETFNTGRPHSVHHTDFARALMATDEDPFVHFIPLVTSDGRIMIDISQINTIPVYGSFGISASSSQQSLAWELLQRIMTALLETPPEGLINRPPRFPILQTIDLEDYLYHAFQSQFRTDTRRLAHLRVFPEAGPARDTAMHQAIERLVGYARRPMVFGGERSPFWLQEDVVRATADEAVMRLYDYAMIRVGEMGTEAVIAFMLYQMRDSE